MAIEIAGLVNSAMVWFPLLDSDNAGSIPAMIEDYLSQLEFNIDADDQLLINLALHALGYEVVPNHSNMEMIAEISMLEYLQAKGFTEHSLKTMLRINCAFDKNAYAILQNNIKFLEDCSELNNEQLEIVKIFISHLVRYKVTSVIQYSPLKIVASYEGGFGDKYDYINKIFEHDKINIPSWVQIDYDYTFGELTCNHKVVLYNNQYHIFSLL